MKPSDQNNNWTDLSTYYSILFLFPTFAIKMRGTECPNIICSTSYFSTLFHACNTIRIPVRQIVNWRDKTKHLFYAARLLIIQRCLRLSLLGYYCWSLKIQCLIVRNSGSLFSYVWKNDMPFVRTTNDPMSQMPFELPTVILLGC